MIVLAVKCPKCSEIIYSRARHDFHHCHCGTVAIDGGEEYVRLSCKPEFKCPSLMSFNVDATKEQLYEDWNTGVNKYGWAKC